MAPHQAAEGVAVAPACENEVEIEVSIEVSIEVIRLVSYPRELYATLIGRSPGTPHWVIWRSHPMT